MKTVALGFLCLAFVLGVTLAQWSGGYGGGYGGGGGSGSGSSWGFLGLIGLLVIILFIFNKDSGRHYVIAGNMTRNSG